MKRRLKSNKGFTLIELIIAVAILVAVVMPMAYVFIQSTDANGRAKKKNNANVVAQNVMEYYKNTSIETLYSTALAEVPDSFTATDSDGDGLNDSFVYEAYEDDGSGNKRQSSDGHYYIKGASGEKYYVSIDISPTGYKEDRYTDEMGVEQVKTMINSYESPRLTDLYNGNNIVAKEEVYKYDSYAPIKLGVDKSAIVKTTILRIETTIYKELTESEFRYKTTVYVDCIYEAPSGAPYEVKRVVASKRFEASDRIPDIYLMYKAFNVSGSITTDRLVVENVYYLDSGATLDLASKQVPRVHIVDSQILGGTPTPTLSGINLTAMYAYASSPTATTFIPAADYIKVYSDIDGLTSKGLTDDGEATNSLYTITVTVREKTYDGKVVATVSSAKEASYESQIE